MKEWEKVGAVGSAVGAVAAIVALAIGYFQLQAAVGANQLQISSLEAQLASSKTFATEQAIDGYLSKPQLIAAKDIINSMTKNGQDYSNVPEDGELNNAVIAVLNYLQTMATGIRNSSYDDLVMCRSLKRVVEKQVEVHIFGQRPTGVSITNPQPFSRSEFKPLVEMYQRWGALENCG